MQAKTIKKILKSKLTNWADSIEDEKVRSLVKKNTILTGGAIASMLLDEEVKDFDVYFRDHKTTVAVAEYYVSKFNENNGENAKVLWSGDLRPEDDINRVRIMIKSRGVASERPTQLDKPFEDVFDVVDKEQVEATEDGRAKFRPIFLSSNAITLSQKIQIVVRFHGEPAEIHKNYDFVHCTNYYDMGEDLLALNQNALESLLSKTLVYQGSKYPLCSVIRTRKFIQRGWHINAGQYLKMCFQLSELDLKDINVLEDQLIGVDSAYFGKLIAVLRDKYEGDSNFVINDGYLSTLIDKIF